MTLRFKADVANTGAATLNVNGLGAVSIVTGVSTALATGDILANQICEVVYNSTGPAFELVNPASAVLIAPLFTNGTTTKNAADASTTQNIAHGLGKIPKNVRIIALGSSVGEGAQDFNTYEAMTTYNGTTQSSVSTYGQASNPYSITAATFTLNASSAVDGTQSGVVTFDSTNIIITWTKTASATGTYTILWEAQG
jgi:hypothetical protein